MSTPKVRASFILGLAAIPIGFAAMVFALRTVLHYSPNCTETSAPDAPLGIHLDLVKAEAKNGLRDTYWYRVEINNLTCWKVSIFQAGPLFEGMVTSGRHESIGLRESFFFRVWAPDGREQVTPDDDAWLVRQFSPLFPYERSSRGRATVDESYVVLPPGGSVASGADEFSPHFPTRLPGWDQEFDYSTPEGRRLDRALTQNAAEFFEKIWRSKHLPSPPAAVPGHASFLHAASFRRPGRYKVAAVFEGNVAVSKVFPLRDRLPERLRAALEFMGEFLGVDIVPRPEGRFMRIVAQSAPVEIEVAP